MAPDGTWHRDGHAWYLLPRQHLPKTGNNSWHAGPVPTHYSHGVHATRCQWSVYLSIHKQTQISNRSLLCIFYIFPLFVGVFEVSCLVSDHYVGGMRQLYRVMGSEDEDISVLESQIIEYFICAEEVEWDYSPDRTWELENFNTTEDNRSVNIQHLLLELRYLNGIL